MAVSRETVLFYEPKGGAQGALLKPILVRMGVRIKKCFVGGGGADDWLFAGPQGI